MCRACLPSTNRWTGVTGPTKHASLILTTPVTTYQALQQIVNSPIYPSLRQPSSYSLHMVVSGNPKARPGVLFCCTTSNQPRLRFRQPIRLRLAETNVQIPGSGKSDEHALLLPGPGSAASLPTFDSATLMWSGERLTRP